MNRNSTSDPLRVAVIGCGDISGVHLDAIDARADATLVAVADTDPNAATSAAARYRTNAYRDLDDVLQHARPDVVHICTPHDLHAPLAISCLRRGVHVLLEKPLAATIADGEAVVAAARDSRATLGVCFQNRYNSTSRELRRLLSDADAGSILGARASVTWFRDAGYYQRRPWRGTFARSGGGVLINQAIHTLDLLQWLLGDIDRVGGQVARLAIPDPVDVEDTACVRLHHRSGATSILYATNGYVDNEPVSLELVTERATFRIERDLTTTYSDGRREVCPEDLVATGERAYWGAAHALLIDDFYAQVRAGRPFWIDAGEALKTLRIIDAVYSQSPSLAASQVAAWQPVDAG